MRGVGAVVEAWGGTATEAAFGWSKPCGEKRVPSPASCCPHILGEMNPGCCGPPPLEGELSVLASKSNAGGLLTSPPKVKGVPSICPWRGADMGIDSG
jgi:hypothetical protein